MPIGSWRHASGRARVGDLFADVECPVPNSLSGDVVPVHAVLLRIVVEDRDRIRLSTTSRDGASWWLFPVGFPPGFTTKAEFRELHDRGRRELRCQWYSLDASDSPRIAEGILWLDYPIIQTGDVEDELLPRRRAALNPRDLDAVNLRLADPMRDDDDETF